MIEKLGNNSKQKLTTLAILGVIAGMGYQIDTAQADTKPAANENPGEENTAVSSTANDLNKNETVLTPTQKDVDAGTPGGQNEKGNPGSSDDLVKEPSEEESQQQPNGNPAGEPGAPGNVDNNKNEGATNDGLKGNEEPAQTSEKSAEPAGTEVKSQTPAPMGLAVKAQAPAGLLNKQDLVKEVAAPVVQTGKWGTSAWKLDDQGVLSIGAGTLGTSADMNAVKGNVTKVVFGSGVVLPWNSSKLFDEWTKVKSYEGLENVDASAVNLMTNMFAFNFALENIDLSSWDMSNVNNMLGIFQGPDNDPDFSLGGDNYMHLTSVKLGSNFGKNSVNMSAMFEGDKLLTSVDAANWDVSKVHMMSNTFRGTGFAALDLSNWQVQSNVQAIDMFSEMYNLTTLNLTGWNLTGNVSSMFANDVKMSSLDLTNLAGTGVYNQVHGMTGLKQLTLGPNNLMATQGYPEWTMDIPEITPSDDYTGLWQFVGTGTVANPNGPTYTAAELMAAYDGATMAGTYVWQKTTPKPTTPTNPGTDTGNTTNPTTPDVDNTTDPTTPDTTAPEQGGDADVITGGDAATIDNTTTPKAKKGVVQAAVATKTTRSARKATSGAPVTVAFAKTDHSAKATHLAQPATKQQRQKTTLPQTGEQSTGWMATIAGVIGLSLLGLNWFKRQN